MYISRMWGKTSWADWPLICFVFVRDVITCFKFGDDRFRGLASAEGQILPFLIDFDGRPYTTLTNRDDYIYIKLRRRWVMPRETRAAECWTLHIFCTTSGICGTTSFNTNQSTRSSMTYIVGWQHRISGVFPIRRNPIRRN